MPISHVCTCIVCLSGGGFTSSRGTFGKVAKNCDMLCLAFGKTADITYSGGSDGNVFVWAGTNLQKVVKAHQGPLFAMHSLDKVSSQQLFMSDNFVQLCWEIGQQLNFNFQ